MKRAFPVMAVLFCCMIFCMTGCGSSEKSDSGAKEEKTVKKQEQQNEKEEEKESEKEPEILQFVDVYGQQYSVEINQNIAKKQYNDTLFIHDGDRLTYADVTWSQAFADCKSRGGYLVRINSEEEYQYILKQLDAGSYQKIQFFIGGRRDSGSSEYYWADEDDELYGDQINTSSYWCSSEWLSGEPSFRDGANEEEYLDLLYYKNEGRWTWNDAPNDILAVVPSFSGRIGYICEYED